MDLMSAIRALTMTPARIMGLDAGTLAVGAPADIAIFDPQASWDVGPNTWNSQGRNTPYWGQTLQGQVRYTFLGGQCVFERKGV
jgi:dihydroorotase